MSGTWADAGLRVVWTDFPEVVPDTIGPALRADAVAYWKLDEVSGTRVDSTGHSYNLSSANNILSTTGKINDAPYWDGSSRYLYSSNSVFNISGTSYTFCAWIYLTAKTIDRYFISKEDSVSFADPYVLAYYQPDDKLEFWIGDGVDYPTVSADDVGSPSLSTWYFVIGWYDFAMQTINMQANNGTVYSLLVSISPSNNSNNFNIGSVLDGTNPMNGRIDEVGFWKRVLTADERAYLYNSGNGRTLYP